MALKSFFQWLQESSPSTRWRDGWGRYGNYPPSASVMSRSTPIPYIMDKAIKEFGTPRKKKRKKRKKHNESYFFDENKLFIKPKKSKPVPVTHDDFDKWLKSLDGLADDLKALEDAKKKFKDKIDSIKEKHKGKKKDKQVSDKDKSDQEKQPKEEKNEKGNSKSKGTRIESDKKVLPEKGKIQFVTYDELLKIGKKLPKDKEKS